MATQQPDPVKLYSLNNGGIVNMPPYPQTWLRNPTSADFAQPGQLVRNVVNPAVPVLWLFAGSNNGKAIWQQIEASGGAGIFSSLSVSPGLTSVKAFTQVGTALINTSGAAASSIGVGGTGAVHIGNATGNTDIPAGNFTVTLGNIVVSAGNITATLGNIAATAGSLSAGTTVTGGTGVNATTGNIAALAGGLRATTTGATTGAAVDTSAGSGVGQTITTSGATVDALQLTGGGIKTAPVVDTGGASPRTVSARFGQASFSNVINAGAPGALTVTNSLSLATSVVIATVSCSTVGSACVIRNIDVSTPGSIVFNVTNLGGTDTAANILINFWLLS